MLEKIQDLIKHYNKLKSDKDRFHFIIANKDIFILHLDNDDTFPGIADHIAYKYSEDLIEALPSMDSFDSYLGWTQCVVDLLEIIGIKGEPV